MEYTQGMLSRVFVVKIENGDDVLESINEIVAKEKISSCVLFMIGAMKNASFVVGPKEPVLPPEPVWKDVSDGREIVGIGTLFQSDSGPKLHLHAGIGRDNEVNIGCIRKDAFAYIVVEIVIMEISGINVTRAWDEKLGLNMLKIINLPEA